MDYMFKGLKNQIGNCPTCGRPISILQYDDNTGMPRLVSRCQTCDVSLDTSFVGNNEMLVKIAKDHIRFWDDRRAKEEKKANSMDAVEFINAYNDMCSDHISSRQCIDSDRNECPLKEYLGGLHYSFCPNVIFDHADPEEIVKRVKNYKEDKDEQH